MERTPPIPSVHFLFDLKSLYTNQQDELSAQSTALKISELADGANNELNLNGAEIRVEKEPYVTSTKGNFEIIIQILITVAIAARAAKPLIEAVATLIGKLNERFPNNEFDLTFPDGKKLHMKGRLSSKEFDLLAENVARHLRDTDLAALKAGQPTYIISLGRRDPDV